MTPSSSANSGMRYCTHTRLSSNVSGSFCCFSVWPRSIDAVKENWKQISTEVIPSERFFLALVVCITLCTGHTSWCFTWTDEWWMHKDPFFGEFIQSSLARLECLGMVQYYTTLRGAVKLLWRQTLPLPLVNCFVLHIFNVLGSVFLFFFPAQPFYRNAQLCST